MNIGITTAGTDQPLDLLLKQLEGTVIDCVDCSLTRILHKNWDQFNLEEIETIGKKFKDHGITIHSLQSIFFGSNLNFSNRQDFPAILNHLDRLVQYQKILNVKKVLFGSPAQRMGTENKDFIGLLVEINKMFFDNGLIFNVENIPDPYNKDLFGGTMNSIVNHITTNNLTNFGINLHLFLEDKQPEGLHMLVNSIHLSYKNFRAFSLDQTILPINIPSKGKPLIFECNFSEVAQVIPIIEYYAKEILC